MFNLSFKTVSKRLAAGIALILSFSTLTTSLKNIFNVDVLDVINDSLVKKRFAEAYGNNPPSTAFQYISAKRGESEAFSPIDGSDPNGDSVTFLVDSIPSSLVCLNSSQSNSLLINGSVLNLSDIVSCTPNISSALGNAIFTVTPVDGRNLQGETVDYTVNVTNNIPAVSDISKVTTKNTSVSFAVSDFQSAFSDLENTPVETVKITTLPTNGVLKLNGTNVSLNQEISVLDLNSLTYSPNSNFVGTDLIGWNGFDDNDYAPSSANINITVNGVAPIASNGGVIINLNNISQNSVPKTEKPTEKPTENLVASTNTPVTENISTPQKTIALSLQKNIDDSKITTGTTFKVQANITNPNLEPAYNVKTVITLDNSRLSLIPESIKEGKIDNTNASPIVSLMSLFSIQAKAADAEIKVVSNNQIEVTYASLSSGETKNINFEVMSKVQGSSEINGVTQIGETGQKATAKLAVESNSNEKYLTRTGGSNLSSDQIFKLLTPFIGLFLIFAGLAIKREPRKQE